MKGQVLRDMQRADWEVALDDLGEQVFAGCGRADPLLARFAAEVGQYAGQDEGYSGRSIRIALSSKS